MSKEISDGYERLVEHNVNMLKGYYLNKHITRSSLKNKRLSNWINIQVDRNYNNCNGGKILKKQYYVGKAFGLKSIYLTSFCYDDKVWNLYNHDDYKRLKRVLKNVNINTLNKMLNCLYNIFINNKKISKDFKIFLYSCNDNYYISKLLRRN